MKALQTVASITEGKAMDLIFDACRKLGKAENGVVTDLRDGFGCEFQARNRVLGGFTAMLTNAKGNCVATAVVDQFDF